MLVSLVYIHTDELFIKEDLENIFKLKYSSFEVIVVTSEKRSLISKLNLDLLKRRNLSFLEIKNNFKIGSLYNYGASVCRGKYLMFLKGGNRLYPDSLDILTRKISGSNSCFGKAREIPLKKTGSYITRFSGGKHNPLSAGIISRDYLNFVGGFNPDLERSSEDDLMGRIASPKRINNFILEVVYDLDSPISPLDRNKYPRNFYPLKSYWSARKSISVNVCGSMGESLFNLIHCEDSTVTPWAVTQGRFNTDILVVDDLPVGKVDSAIIWIKKENKTLDGVSSQGVISYYPSSGEESLVYRHLPLISREELIKLDQEKFPYKNEFSILWLENDSANCSTLRSILEQLCKDIGSVTLIFKKNKDIYNFFAGIPKLIVREINNLSFSKMKELCPTVVISLGKGNIDPQISHYSFIVSSLLRIPFIAFPSETFKNILVKDLDFYPATSIIQYLSLLKRIKKNNEFNDISRKTLLAYYTYDSARVSFLYFINRVYEEHSLIKPLNLFSKNNYSVKIIGEDKCSSWYPLSESGALRQECLYSFTSLSGRVILRLDFKLLFNKEGDITVRLISGDDFVDQVTVPFFKLEYGINKFSLKRKGDLKYFEIFSSAYSFKIRYTDTIRSVGNLYEVSDSLASPIKGCLCFSIYDLS